MTDVATAYLEGIGLWSDSLPGWQQARAILRGEQRTPQAAERRPSPRLLPANERRRAPDTVALALEVAAEACAQARRDPATLPSVFASTYGDLAIMDYMCATLATTPELVSPTKFHNSVHNAAAGYWAIATGCQQPYTALSAGQYSFGSGLLETLVQASSDDANILYVAYDIEAIGALSQVINSRGRLGCALVINAVRSAHARLAIQWRLRDGPPNANASRASDTTALPADNALSDAMPLLRALADAAGRVTLGVAPNLSLELVVEDLHNDDAAPAREAD